MSYVYLDTLYQNANVFSALGTNEIFELVCLSVDINYARQNIGAELVNRSLKLTKEHNIMAVETTATSKIHG